jgi:CRP-like cAMP-binding protein
MEDLLDDLGRVYRISDTATRDLQAIVRLEHFGKQALIQAPDSRCRTIYIMRKGLARIFYYKDGHDITEYFAFDGDVIVRAESLFTGQPTSKGIQALEETSLLAIDANGLFALYDKHHDIERLFRLIFEKAHVAVIRRLESLQFKTATERYRELLSSTDYVRLIPLKHIASYLGITQVTLSRIRARIPT